MQVHTLPVPALRNERTGRYAPAVHQMQRDELFCLWSAARAEANLALDEWRAVPGAAAYAAYRAAEDRADAAQDALAALL